MKAQNRPARGGCFKWPGWIFPLAGFAVCQLLPAADFGDAPDGGDTHYPVTSAQPAVTGNFPTLFSSGGALHVNLGEEWLGGPNSAPSSEADANDPADPDGLPNLVNNDHFDDAFPPIPFFLTLTSLPPSATVTFRVTVAAGAPDMDRVVNMLIDWDRSGNWQDIPGAAPEWAIRNHVVRIPPGTTQLVTVPIQWGLGAQLAPQIFWVRLTLSRQAINPALYPNGWDGTGTFLYGETEDFLFHPNRRHDSVPPWVPPGNPPPGWPPPGFPPGNLPSISLTPKSQDVAHGTPATVTVVVTAGGPPGTIEWTPDASIPWQPFGSVVSFPPTGTMAVSTPGGLPPSIGNITFSSVVHPLFPPMEEHLVRVKARWPGIRVQIRKAIVRIWHSGWYGIFGIYSHFPILEEQVIGTVPVAHQPTLLGYLATANTSWRQGNYPAALVAMGDFDDEIDALIGGGLLDPSIGMELKNAAKDIALAIDGLGMDPVPVPVLVNPVDGDTLTGVVVLEAVTDSPDVTRADFYIAGSVGDPWMLLGSDLDPKDGMTLPFDSSAYPEGAARLRVEMANLLGSTGEHEAGVWLDNSAPPPALISPPEYSELCGISAFQVHSDPDDDAGCLMEISADGSHWFAIGGDLDGADGHLAVCDTGQLDSDKYDLRATVTDTSGNSTVAVWPMAVYPSFHAWRNMVGQPESEAESDLDQDGVPLGFEYYFGLGAIHHDTLADHILWEQLGGPDFQLRFAPAELLDGIRCTVESTEDLETWSDLLADPVPGPGGEVVVPVPTLPGRFVRLNVYEDRP